MGGWTVSRWARHAWHLSCVAVSAICGLRFAAAKCSRRRARGSRFGCVPSRCAVTHVPTCAGIWTLRRAALSGIFTLLPSSVLDAGSLLIGDSMGPVNSATNGMPGKTAVITLSLVPKNLQSQLWQPLELWATSLTLAPLVVGDENVGDDIDDDDFDTWRSEPATINLIADGHDDGLSDASDFVFWRN